jgi:hypothetical protein
MDVQIIKVQSNRKFLDSIVLVYCLKIFSSLEFSTFGHFSADDSMN